MKKFFYNLITSWGAIATQLLVIFFLTPYVISTIGKERYAIWLLTNSITGQYGLLACGLQGAVTAFLAQSFAKKDYDGMNVVASTAFMGLLCIGGAIVVLGFLGSLVVPALFNVPEVFLKELQVCISLMAISTGLELTFFVFTSSLTAAQRFDVSNYIDIATLIFRAFLTVVFLGFGWSLVGICAAFVLTNILSAFLRYLTTFKILPHLKISIRIAKVDCFFRLAAYSGWSSLSNLSLIIYRHIDTLVIAVCLPISRLAPYGLAAGLVSQSEAVVNPIARQLFPVLVDHHTNRREVLVEKILIAGTVGTLTVSGILLSSAYVWSSDFFRLWLKDTFSPEDRFGMSIVFAILGLAVLARQYSCMCYQYLLGSNNPKRAGLYAVAESSANVALSFAFAFPFGVRGVAFATLVSAMCIHAILVPSFVLRQLHSNGFRFFLRVVPRPMFAIASSTLGAVVVKNSCDPPNSILSLIAIAGFGLAIGSPLMWFLGVSSTYRGVIVKSLLAKC